MAHRKDVAHVRANKRTVRCEDCGQSITYYADNKYGPPKRCMDCRNKREANRRKKKCESCGGEIIYYADMPSDQIPKYCSECKKDINTTCDICGGKAATRKYFTSPPLCTRCKDDRDQIKKKSSYSPAINKHIRFLHELEYYMAMGLQEATINGRKCLEPVLIAV